MSEEETKSSALSTRVPSGWWMECQCEIKHLRKWEDLRAAKLDRVTTSLLYEYATSNDGDNPSDGQKAKDEWVLDVVDLFDRAIYAERQFLSKKGSPSEKMFYERVREARTRLFELPLPGRDAGTVRDVLRDAASQKGLTYSDYPAPWMYWLHVWRHEFVKLFLKRGFLGQNYYLALLHWVVERYGVHLSLNDLVDLANGARAALTVGKMRRAGRTEREIGAAIDHQANQSASRATLGRLLKNLEPSKDLILDSTLPLLSDLLPQLPPPKI